MAHFAELDSNNVVLRVTVVDNYKLRDPSSGLESEVLGIAFCKKLFGGEWIQTSVNNTFRKRFANRGDTYNKELDAFIPPKPYESWILNPVSLDWEPPIPKPEVTEEQENNNQWYNWNEETSSWELVTS
jgi:hypothetical protein